MAKYIIWFDLILVFISCKCSETDNLISDDLPISIHNRTLKKCISFSNKDDIKALDTRDCPIHTCS